MNLRKAMFWREADVMPGPSAAEEPPSVTRAEPPPATQAAPETAAPASRPDESEASAMVIPLQRPGAASPGEQAQDEFAAPPVQPVKLRGLKNAPELEAFFKANHFGYGRHHGSRYRTVDALELGLEAAVTEFQNILADMAERRQAKLDKLELARLQVAGLSVSMAGQLELTSQQTEREMAALREQMELAGHRKGWVLDALNRYRLGFDRGVREALDFELLNI